MTLVRRLALALILAMLATGSQADTFLGVEGDEEEAPTKKPKRAESEASADDDDEDAAASASAESSGGSMSKRASRPSSRGAAPIPMSGDINFGAALGASAHTVSGEGTLSYSLNRYAAVDTTGHYQRYQRGGDSGLQWGPEVAFILRYQTPFLVTPFVGAGPGYVKWERRHDNELFSDGGALTGAAFGGIDIRLTQHFGVRLVRRQRSLYHTPPKSFADRDAAEAKTTVTNSIGFHVLF